MNFDPDAHFEVTYFKPAYGRPIDGRWALTEPATKKLAIDDLAAEGS